MGEGVEEKEALALGVSPEGRAVLEGVGVLVGLALLEEEKEALAEMLGLGEALAPLEMEPVGEWEPVRELLRVAVMEPVPEKEGV